MSVSFHFLLEAEEAAKSQDTLERERAAIQVGAKLKTFRDFGSWELVET